MNTKTAVVLGGSGLVGSQLLQQLLNDDEFIRVRALVRRPLAITHPKLETLLVDFNDYTAFQQKLGKGDCIFCCIGTTHANVAGDKAAYRKIDFDIPVNAARFGKEAGFQQYLLVSAMGANPKSYIFYSRLKGEVEEVIATFGFSAFHVFRPSFLLGYRIEKRTAERIFKSLAKTLAFLIPSRYKPIEAADVAKAMIRVSKLAKPGLHVYYYSDMITYK